MAVAGAHLDILGPEGRTRLGRPLYSYCFLTLKNQISVWWYAEILENRWNQFSHLGVCSWELIEWDWFSALKHPGRDSQSVNSCLIVQVITARDTHRHTRTHAHALKETNSHASGMAVDRPSHWQMDGVNIIIKHLGRRFLFTAWLLGSDISWSLPPSSLIPSLSLTVPLSLSHTHHSYALSLW